MFRARRCERCHADFVCREFLAACRFGCLGRDDHHVASLSRPISRPQVTGHVAYHAAHTQLISVHAHVSNVTRSCYYSCLLRCLPPVAPLAARILALWWRARRALTSSGARVTDAASPESSSDLAERPGCCRPCVPSSCTISPTVFK